MNFNPETFLDAFGFMAWGDDHLLNVAATIQEAEYLRDRGISAGSLHRLLIHMMAAQWVWLSRWQGVAMPYFETDRDHPNLVSLRNRWAIVHEETRDFLIKQTAESLAANFSYKDSRGNPHSLPLGRFVQHMLDHGTYHRGQANTLIKLSGGQPINLSLYRYYEKV